ncbi:DEAD/DEAH box helicase family protein [Thermococcus sp. 21S7]|uniref:DEAD/DEAH box helicase family protein n=1 Tax=Thermococcus sp. 21S7 TaxID=1638221 RepID=UPI00143C237B|nr:DEAD/DEAH box helicase family protein [Thermococcus sp. 21S7]NJE60170.1 hypothetical protein [Thermococcus sp. 21S7]
MSRKDIPILYGEAFELGVNRAIAEKAYVLPEEAFLEDFMEEPRDEGLLVEARELAMKYVDFYDRILSSKEPLAEFLEYYKTFQSGKRSRKINVEELDLTKTDKMNILALLELGRKTGELLRRRYPEFLLQPPLRIPTSYEKYLYPDFIAFSGIEPLAIGDFKVSVGFLGADLSSVVWSVNFDYYNVKELALRAISLSPDNFKSLYKALSKYFKAFHYATIFNMFPIDVLVVFPLGVSILRFNSREELDEMKYSLKDLVRKMIPEQFKEHASDILKYLTDGSAYVRKDENSKKFYLVIDNGNAEIPLWSSGCYPSWKYGSVKTGEPKYTDIKGRRKRHEADVERLIEEVDLLIDASDQGVGKNHVLLKHIAELAKAGKRALIIAPRKHILYEAEAKLRENYSGIRLIIVTSEGKRSIEKVETYQEGLNAPEGREWRATGKLTEYIRSKEYSVILTTTATFQWLRSNVWKLILRDIDVIVFDEFTNSGSPAVESILGFLRFYSRNPNGRKVIITDASITEPRLFLDAFKKHLSAKGPLYTPLEVLISESSSDPIVERFDINNISAAYYRLHLDFELKFYALGFGVEGKLPDWHSLIERISRMVKKDVDFKKLLEQGKVVFYADNKLYVDDLTEFLLSQGFKAEEVHSGIERDSSKLKGNIVGTSSLAFGANLENHEILVFIPPYPGHRYIDNAYNVELYRQVIKRLRGYKGKPKHIVFVGLAEKEEDESMHYYMVRNFIRKILTNRSFHVRLPMFSSESGSFYSAKEQPLRTGEKREVPVETFLRDYYPQLKRILSAAGFIIRPTFHLQLSLERDWNLPIPYRVYKIAGEHITKKFGFEVLPLKDFSDQRERLLELMSDKRYKEGAQILLGIVGRDFNPLNYKNEYVLARVLERKLKPEWIKAGYSSVLLVPFIYPRSVEKLPHGLESPLKKLFLGDWRYVEIPVKVIEEREKGKFEVPGILAFHPGFGKRTERGDIPFREKIVMALEKERKGENTLYLPNVWKAI